MSELRCPCGGELEKDGVMGMVVYWICLKCECVSISFAGKLTDDPEDAYDKSLIEEEVNDES